MSHDLTEGERRTGPDANTVDARTERRIERFLTRNPQASTVAVIGALLLDPAKRDQVEAIVADQRGDA